MAKFAIGKMILRDCATAGVLFMASIAIGGITNHFRAQPLPLEYMSEEERLNQAVKQMGISEYSGHAGLSTINITEMQEICSSRPALIVDARPEVYYRLSHIPNALSLPRDDFKRRYIALKETLIKYRDRTIVVYCNASDCNDSSMVANALMELGYSHVQIFRGGWSEWLQANMREEVQWHGN